MPSPANPRPARLDLRVRVFGYLYARSRRTAVHRMSPTDLARAQRRPLPRGRLARAVFGTVPPDVDIEDRTVGELTLRWYRGPGTGVRPLVLYLHGGGWTLGSLDAADWWCAEVARSTGAVVGSVDYRLAPAHPFPAAVEDSFAALRWTAAHAAELGADADRLAVMGDSAGGNLAAVLCLLTRDRGGPPVRHQTLVYPVTDLTLSGASVAAYPDAPILTAAALRAYVAHYLGTAGDPRDRYASPLLAPDLAGLPPALVQVAEQDPLADDGRRYAQRMRDAGVEVRLSEYVRMPHGYATFPGLCGCARPALVEACAQVRAHLGGPEPGGARPSA